MKYKLLFLFVILFSGFALSQYPLVTLYDINYISDPSILPNFPPSPLAGDTVRVRGVVTVRTVVGSSQPGVGDRRPVIWVGAGWECYIQDKDNPEWGGIAVYQADTTSSGAQQTLLDLADSATVYEFTGIVVPYFQATELQLITAPNPIPIEEIEVLTKRPDPIPLTIDSLFSTPPTGNYLMRKYQGVYVEFVADANHNLITSDRVTGSGSTSGNFKINDGNGKFVMVYAQSTYFKMNSSGIRPGYQSPADGSYLSYIRGILTMRNDQGLGSGVSYWLVPLYPEDLGSTLIIPPSVSNVRRDIAMVQPNQAVTVTCIAKGVQTPVQTVKLFYRVNDGNLDSLDMSVSTADTIYSVQIPGVPDSALVDYYIKATDQNGTSVTNPSNIVTGRYFYLVLNRTLTIKDLQYSPFGGNFSAYNNYRVTDITGVITADTVGSFYRTGNVTNRIIMQDGQGPWSGIWLSPVNSTFDIQSLKAGDKVTVNGTVVEDFSFTRIDSITSLIVVSSGNPLPQPQVLTTGTIGTKFSGNVDAEQWEGVLLQFNNVTITDVNADGNPGTTNNFGEIFVSDGSGNVRTELQDGNHYYHNGWDASLYDNSDFFGVDSGDTFTSLSGYLYFSFSYYKLVPRYNSDFNGYIPLSVDDNNNTIPNKYVVEQNYPNPFNPSTVISYAIPKEGLVTINIYNILGQEIATLLNDIQSAGLHKINFDGSKLTSGVYFYRVKSGAFSQVKKMMLVK